MLFIPSQAEVISANVCVRQSGLFAVKTDSLMLMSRPDLQAKTKLEKIF